jgi:hypothetical protein
VSIIPHESVNSTKARVLRRAAQIIEEIGWVRGWFAKDAKGKTLDVRSQGFMKAKGYCLWGAIYRAEREMFDDELAFIFQEGQEHILPTETELDAQWNDRNRNKKSIVNRLNRLADKYENM